MTQLFHSQMLHFYKIIIIAIVSLLLFTLYTSAQDTPFQNRNEQNKSQNQSTNSISAQRSLRKYKKPLPKPNDAQAKRLLESIDKILQNVANQRDEARKLPSRNDYFVAVPPWTETREDREKIIRDLLDSALSVVTDGPIVEYQKKLAARRKTIRQLEEQIAALKEKRLGAPKDSLLPSIIKETVSSIDDKIKELKTRIVENHKEIKSIKDKIRQDFRKKNIEMSQAQLDLLLGSVLSGDIVKLVAAFEAARIIDHRLGQLMSQNSENLEAARRYFAMHAALFAMLLHSQNEVVRKIDKVYLAKLHNILNDIRNARNRTSRLLREQNRPDQRRTLLANKKAQNFAEHVATFYRDYLLTQRKQIIASRTRTVRDLSIADNTFETVEASFQLRSLIEDSKTAFEALERLQAPGFGQVFQNEQLRKEFEKLTEKLNVPTS